MDFSWINVLSSYTNHHHQVYGQMRQCEKERRKLTKQNNTNLKQRMNRKRETGVVCIHLTSNAHQQLVARASSHTTQTMEGQCSVLLRLEGDNEVRQGRERERARVEGVYL